MDPVVYEYRYIEDAAEIIRSLADRDVRFLVPQSADRDALISIIAGGRPLFGTRPQVWLWNDLYHHTGRHIARMGGDVSMRRQIDPPDHYLILGHIVSKLPREGLPPGVLRRGFLDSLSEALRELIREDVSQERLARSLECDFPCSGECPASASALLCRLYGMYLRYLDSHGLADSAGVASLTRMLLVSNQIKPPFSIVMTGYMSLTHGQLSLVRELTYRGMECVFIKPGSHMHGHPDLADQLGVPVVQLGNPPPRIKSKRAGYPDFQLVTAARDLALWGAGEGGTIDTPFSGYEDTGICVQPAQLDVITDALRRYGVPCYHAGGISVAQTYIGQLPRLVLNALRGKWSGRDVAGLLTMPCFDSSGLDIPRALSEGVHGYAGWTEYLQDNEQIGTVFSSIAAFGETMERGAGPVSLLVSYLSVAELLPSVSRSQGSELDGKRRELRMAVSEIERKIKLMEECTPPLGEAADAAMSGDDAVAYLESWAEEAVISASAPISGAVSVYTGTPPALAGHRIFIVTGATASVWPGAVSESALMGDAQRHRINDLQDEDLPATHLPDVAELRLQREALFRRVIYSAGDLCVIYRPDMDEKGRSAAVSHFELSLRSQFAIDDTEECQNMWDTPPGPSFEGDVPAGRVEPRGLPRTELATPTRVPLSATDNFVKCPYYFWCTSIARLESPPEEMFDSARAGNAMHELFARAWQSGAPCGIYSWVQQMYEPIFEEMYGPLVTNGQLRRHALRLRENALDLAALQDEQEERLRARGCTRIATYCEEIAPHCTIGGVTMSGRCDRVDIIEMPDGRRRGVIADYKSGATDKYKSSLQLPAYVAVLGAVNGADIAGYVYMSSSEGAVYGKFSDPALHFVYTGKEQSGRGVPFEDMVERASDVMQRIAASAKEGVWRADYSSDSCTGCSMSALCRRNEALGVLE